METKAFLKSFFTEHWKYLAVSTACRLNLFDALSVSKTKIELSEELVLDENKLSFLLNGLCQIGFLDRKEQRFSLNKNSLLLTETHPESLKYACMHWAEESLCAWQKLYYTIKEGGSSFEHISGKNYFEYLSKYPHKLNDYHKAMSEYAQDDYRELSNVINFQQYSSIMDVGGSFGTLLSKIKEKHPQIKLYLFDLEDVLKTNLNDGITRIAGDFFERLPKVSEAIILSRILHDWNNEKASVIIENCFNALPDGGTLFLVENCSDKIKVDLSLLSLNMSVMCDSYERSSKEYIALCSEKGFNFISDIALNDLQTILIFKK